MECLSQDRHTEAFDLNWCRAPPKVPHCTYDQAMNEFCSGKDKDVLYMEIV